MSDEQKSEVGAISAGNAKSAESGGLDDRRSHARRRVERLAYIRFDKDNGGILLDIGEGGLKFHGVASSLEGEFCVVKFMLPGSGRTIEVRGQITWSNKSRKGGGVRFVDIPEDVRQQIREWMAQENPSLIPTRPVTKPIVSKPPIFLTRERVKAGVPSSAVSQPVMPSLSAAPVAPVAVVLASVVPEVHVEGRSAVPPRPVATIAPEEKVLDTMVASAKVEAVPASALPPVPVATLPKASPPVPSDERILELFRVSVPEQFVDAERASLAVQPESIAAASKTLSDPFTGAPTPPAARTSGRALAGAPAQPQQSSGGWSYPATLPRSANFLGDDLGALKYDRSATGSRVAQIVVVAAFVCAAAAACVVIAPRTPALLASFRGISQASTSSPSAAQAPMAARGQDFSVDAVDSANRHWILQNGRHVAAAAASSNSVSSDSPDGTQDKELGDLPGDLSDNESNHLLGIASDGAKAAASQSLAGRGVTVQPRVSALLASSAAQRLDLRPPTMRQAAPLPARLDAPSLADGVSSANLLDSRALVPTAPSLPAPPVATPSVAIVPAAPASAPASATASAAISKSALRPAVLIHSVPASYPQDVARNRPGSVVRVSAVIDKNGVPMSLKMLSGDPSLSSAAFAAVREYRYDPALLNGEPAESTVVIAVNFQQAK